jgi:hypothetical protein
VLASIVLLVQEFRHFGLLWQIDRVLFAALGLFMLGFAALWVYTKKQYGEVKAYATEIALAALCILPICLLLATKLNGITTVKEEVPFTFIAERGNIKAPFGLLEFETKQITWNLMAIGENGDQTTFTYKGSARYPLTQPGELILLPMERGLLGCYKLVIQ